MHDDFWNQQIKNQNYDSKPDKFINLFYTHIMHNRVVQYT